MRGGENATEVKKANDLEKEAQEIRNGVRKAADNAVEKNPDLNDQYWFLATVAEVHFGLENYDAAGRWLALAREVKSNKGKKDKWQRQTTFKQLVSLARIRGYVPPREGVSVENWEGPWRALYEFLQEDTEPALSCYRGKVGLALSGGGFRASLFHLGVLARMAEMDVLRSVEVLSTVSGGSIVGAHYYLEVKKLLETKKDHDQDESQRITRQDYIDIVRRVQKRFLEGIKTNLRTQALAIIP